MAPLQSLMFCNDSVTFIDGRVSQITISRNRIHCGKGIK
jgi:hypothetical protein